MFCFMYVSDLIPYNFTYDLLIVSFFYYYAYFICAIYHNNLVKSTQKENTSEVIR